MCVCGHVHEQHRNTTAIGKILNKLPIMLCDACLIMAAGDVAYYKKSTEEIKRLLGLHGITYVDW